MDTYVDPSKAGETNSSPTSTEKSQGRQDGNSSETPPADRTNKETKPEDASANPESQSQGGSKETEREKKRGSPRAHELNRNRQRGVYSAIVHAVICMSVECSKVLRIPIRCARFLYMTY